MLRSCIAAFWTLIWYQLLLYQICAFMLVITDITVNAQKHNCIITYSLIAPQQGKYTIPRTVYEVTKSRFKNIFMVLIGWQSLMGIIKMCKLTIKSRILSSFKYYLWCLLCVKVSSRYIFLYSVFEILVIKSIHSTFTWPYLQNPDTYVSGHDIVSCS